MRLILVPLVVVFLSGCHAEPHSWSTFTTKKPLDTDLVGTYAPTAKTLTYIKGKYPDVKMSITLSKDGTFRFDNVPDCWHTPFGEPKGKFDTGSGKWWVSQYANHEWFHVGLNFTSTEGFNSEKCDGQFATSIKLVGEGPRYVLHLTLGDPDQDEAMQFEKMP